MFLPTTKKEMKTLGWARLDVILVSGDAYIDSSYIGVAVIGKWLLHHGFRVGVIAQPNLDTADDLLALGAPKLFWGVSGGAVDSMVANYTATKKRRQFDDYTPGGENNRRPDRAVMTYVNMIRRYAKPTVPVVVGGIEASLRRIAHYDYWTNKVRRSLLFDAKADILMYGMAERAVLELARCLAQDKDWRHIRGLCYRDSAPKDGYVELPPFETVQQDKTAFIDMFHLFYRNNEPQTAQGLFQKHGDKFLIQNPPAEHMSQTELDSVFNLDFERKVHPAAAVQGKVRALDTIQFSLTTHRGCYGECNFCAIAVHQGRTVRSRSEASILQEAKLVTEHSDFKGILPDVGGPTANMYGFECDRKIKKGPCSDRRCLFPKKCTSLQPSHRRQIQLLRQLRQLPGVRKVFVASGIRPDLVLADKKDGTQYLREIANHHVSGQLKIAPEHTEKKVLDLMGKSSMDSVLKFKQMFDDFSRDCGKKQFLTYYFIAAHPGSSDTDMDLMKKQVSRELHMNPEQVQVFIPTPSTYSSVMYYTERDPFTGKSIFVEKSIHRKEKQKSILTEKGIYHKDKQKSTLSEKGAHRKDKQKSTSTEKGAHPKDKKKSTLPEKGAHRKDKKKSILTDKKKPHRERGGEKKTWQRPKKRK